MALKRFLDSLTAGGKVALGTTAAGCIAVLGYSFITDQKTIYLPYTLIAVALVSTLLGGVVGGLTAGTLGWLHGGMIALFYGCATYAVKSLMFPALTYDQDSIMFTAGMLITGMAGGVAGVNLRFFRRTRARRRYMGY